MRFVRWVSSATNTLTLHAVLLQQWFRERPSTIRLIRKSLASFRFSTATKAARTTTVHIRVAGSHLWKKEWNTWAYTDKTRGKNRTPHILSRVGMNFMSSKKSTHASVPALQKMWLTYEKKRNRTAFYAHTQSFVYTVILFHFFMYVYWSTSRYPAFVKETLL